MPSRVSGPSRVRCSRHAGGQKDAGCSPAWRGGPPVTKGRRGQEQHSAVSHLHVTRSCGEAGITQAACTENGATWMDVNVSPSLAAVRGCVCKVITVWSGQGQAVRTGGSTQIQAPQEAGELVPCGLLLQATLHGHCPDLRRRAQCTASGQCPLLTFQRWENTGAGGPRT